MRQRTISPPSSAVRNQLTGLRVNMTAARSPPLPSVNDEAWVSHQFPLPGQSSLQFHSKQQHLSRPVAAIPNHPTGLPVSMTAAKSTPLPSVNDWTFVWVPHQLPARTMVPTLQLAPPIDGCPPMVQQPDAALAHSNLFQQGQSASRVDLHGY